MEEQNNVQVYYGTKRIKAWPENRPVEQTADHPAGVLHGYGVEYEDGYRSWSPKEVFERAYIPLSSLMGPPTQTIMDEITVVYTAKVAGEPEPTLEHYEAGGN